MVQLTPADACELQVRAGASRPCSPCLGELAQHPFSYSAGRRQPTPMSCRSRPEWTESAALDTASYRAPQWTGEGVDLQVPGSPSFAADSPVRVLWTLQLWNKQSRQTTCAPQRNESGRW